MKVMKIAICVMACAFAVFVAAQSYLIAHMGALYQIPQLEGDGGGGMLVAVLCMIGGGLIFFRLWAADTAFLLAALTALLVGLSFQDSTTAWWSIAPFLFACLLIALLVSTKKPKYPKPGT